MTEPSTPPSLDSALAVRRVGKTTMVHLCDLTAPDRVILMSARCWVDWKAEVMEDLFRPHRDGDQITIEIVDRAVGKAAQRLFTTEVAYRAFQSAAKTGRFDGLAPVPYGQKHGPWIWAGGVLQEAEAKALHGAA
ncbi:hypothetical protein [Nonomuraea sp. NPDC049504]|uniref:hypothetical protein n=1 Tax=Nonomuraea sp. NPDC049504 TaxID=3154729 RepID=UPI00342B853C